MMSGNATRENLSVVQCNFSHENAQSAGFFFNRSIKISYCKFCEIKVSYEKKFFLVFILLQNPSALTIPIK